MGMDVCPGHGHVPGHDRKTGGESDARGTVWAAVMGWVCLEEVSLVLASAHQAVYCQDSLGCTCKNKPSKQKHVFRLRKSQRID